MLLQAGTTSYSLSRVPGSSCLRFKRLANSSTSTFRKDLESLTMPPSSQAARGKQLTGSVAYLSNAPEIISRAPWRPTLENGIPSVMSLVLSLQWLAAKHITMVAQQLQVRPADNPTHPTNQQHTRG